MGGLLLTAYTIDVLIGYSDWYLRETKRRGAELLKLKTFSQKKDRAITKVINYLTFIDNHIIKNKDGTLSICFTWFGLDDRNLSIDELQAEHSKRVAFLKGFSADDGISVENHFLRLKDARKILAYKKFHQEINKKHSIPPIIHEVKMNLADSYIPLARENTVFSVITIGKPHTFGVLDAILPKLNRLKKEKIDLSAKLYDYWSYFKDEFAGADLVTKDRFIELIQKVNNPFAEYHGIDWRYEIASQLITEKPKTNSKTLQIGSIYYRVVVLQGYPKLKFKWSNLYCERSTNIHVCQYYQPVNTSIAIDTTATKDVDEQKSTTGAKGQYQLGAKLNDSRSFKKYVSQTQNAIHRNFFIATFMGESEEEVIRHSTDFEKQVNRSEGRARTDIDIQAGMYFSRLPGQGRIAPFIREQDHSDTIALMMPFTTYLTGSKRPESMRMTSSGAPVFYSPSDLEVPHELCVAQMGGGKDTQLGLTISETFHAIRYDIIELGTSYRGIIEAIGGRYCKAREQIINPLAGYDEFDRSKQQIGNTGRDLSRDFVNMQTAIIQPIFADSLGGNFTTVQELVMNKAIRALYENPVRKLESPLLPDLLQFIDRVETEEQRHEDAKNLLADSLSDFLELDIGKEFKNKDQFIISPVANAIDFDKFSGKLFEFFLTFVCTRLITNAMASSSRNQIVLNEYGTLVERAPAVMKTVTMTLDRMGRKELCGLSRNTQELDDVTDIGTGAINAIPNKILLSRTDRHQELGDKLLMPEMMVRAWEGFLPPEVMDQKGYRQAIVSQRNQWHNLYLLFPQLLLDLMNTSGKDKSIREQVYDTTQDPYERIALFRKLKAQRSADNENHII